MRLRLIVALVCSAPASWAGERIGLEVESGAGLNWALTELCRYCRTSQCSTILFVLHATEWLHVPDETSMRRPEPSQSRRTVPGGPFVSTTAGGFLHRRRRASTLPFAGLGRREAGAAG